MIIQAIVLRAEWWETDLKFLPKATAEWQR